MPQTRGHSRWWVLLPALLLPLAACAQTGHGPSTSPTRPSTQGTPTNARPATPAAVTWVGQLCTTVGDLVQTIQNATPDTGQATTPEGLKRAWSNQLGAASTTLTATADRLGQLGSSPVTDGDQTARDLATKYAKLTEPINQAKKDLDDLSPGSDEKAVGKVMAIISPTLASLTSHPLKDVALSPDLTTAGNQSP